MQHASRSKEGVNSKRGLFGDVGGEERSGVEIEAGAASAERSRAKRTGRRSSFILTDFGELREGFCRETEENSQLKM